jgi:hypothetical protein
MERGRFGVQVREGDQTTSHQVVVPPGMVDDLGLTDVDPETLVRESFSFLLEREPATSIMPEFALSDIAKFFNDYYDELRRRLGSAFTTAELAELYDEGTGWVSDVAVSAAPDAPFAWDVRIVGDAAFGRYVRNAVDYSGGRRLNL